MNVLSRQLHLPCTLSALCFWVQSEGEQACCLRLGSLVQTLANAHLPMPFVLQDLGDRYGHPTVVLSLVKSAEKRPRETILRKEFNTAISYINQQVRTAWW